MDLIDATLAAQAEKEIRQDLRMAKTYLGMASLSYHLFHDRKDANARKLLRLVRQTREVLDSIDTPGGAA